MPELNGVAKKLREALKSARPKGAPKTTPYPLALRARAVAYAKNRKAGIETVAEELGIAHGSLRNWIEQRKGRVAKAQRKAPPVNGGTTLIRRGPVEPVTIGLQLTGLTTKQAAELLRGL